MPTDERWVFGHALNVENPQVGKFERKTLYSQLTLVSGTPVQTNWVLAAVPTPNVTEGWRVARVMVRVVILGRSGGIDKVGVRDGEREYHEFNESIGPQPNWVTLSFDLPLAKPNIQFGLGVSIHAFAAPTSLGPNDFRFVSVGALFAR
jgi:hypothetical protein